MARVGAEAVRDLSKAPLAPFDDDPFSYTLLHPPSRDSLTIHVQLGVQTQTVSETCADVSVLNATLAETRYEQKTAVKWSSRSGTSASLCERQ